MIKKKPLKLIEIQESVLPDAEWIIGISIPDYFNGVGYSMPGGLKANLDLGQDNGMVSGGRISSDLVASSNLDDAVKVTPIEDNEKDTLLSNFYKHNEDSVVTSNDSNGSGPCIDYPASAILFENLAANREVENLYAFIPGIFYCSALQTSVDAILIEVTQTQRFGMTLSSFRPEDVLTLDISKGFTLDPAGSKKSIQVTIETLGSFQFDDFLKDSGISTDDVIYSREVELAEGLSKQMALSDLKKAYASSSFLRTRLIKLLDDIEFFGLAPRHRIYVRNEKHPYGRVVEVNYRGFEGVINLGVGHGISCGEEIDLENELNALVFTKLMGTGIETNIEHAIMEMFYLVETGLAGKITKSEVLSILTREIV